MKNLNKLKSKLIQSIDYFNDLFYPYLSPQLPSQNQIDLKPSLTHLEEQAYQDALNRIDPDGIYHYRWHPDRMGVPDLGDMCLNQGIFLGTIASRIKHIGEGGVQFKTFDTLLCGIEHFIEDGYLIRGKCRHIKMSSGWIQGEWQYASDLRHPPVSGDQLAGFCFGLSLAYRLHPARFSNSLKQKILLFTDRMIANKMMLQERNGKTASGDGSWLQQEIPYDSWREQNGSAVTKLALLSLASKIAYSYHNKYYRKYDELLREYSFDSLAEYSSFFFGSENNYFGTNICALSLFAIGLNMNFPDYVTRGLKRIAWQTRDYGYALFDLLILDPSSIPFDDVIKKKLYSHFIPCGEDIFKRSVFFFGKKKRVSALSIRAKGKEEFEQQRNPFRERNNFNPDLWALNNSGYHGFLLEYWLAKYLEVI